MNLYFLGKLHDINYQIAIHEGDANMRLASQSYKILFQLKPYKNEIPYFYIKDFENLINIIEGTLAKNIPGLIPLRLIGIYKRTASKYIKLLIDIENYINS